MTDQKYLVDFEPTGRRIEVEPGVNLLEAAQKAGIDLVAACGGVGICGTCKLRRVGGSLTPVTPGETEHLTPAELNDGYRLACQARPLSDVRLDIPPESLPVQQKLQVEGSESELRLDPAVTALDLSVPPPDLHNLLADVERVNEALARQGKGPVEANLATLSELSQTLRRHNWSARLAVKASSHPGATHLAAALAPGTHLLGLAVDIGSTKLAVYLVDLENGATLAQRGAMNPQIAYGEDVVSRIAYANKSEENRRQLQTRLVDALNKTIDELCAQAACLPVQIVEGVVVGNTAMHHFFCGLPVTQLGQAPYVPAVSQPLTVSAAEIGLHTAPGADIFLPGNIAGYVGADHTSALLTTRGYTDGVTLALVDIGTNTEISVIHNGVALSCSCASGPAFEGAHIHDGMRAAPGAIERVHITPQEVQVTTVGSTPPVGICGSGILNAISEMLDAGLLDERGMLTRGGQGVRATSSQVVVNSGTPNGNGRLEFLLAPASATGHGRDLVINRHDVHEIQLAKAAIRAGIEILLEEAGIAPHDVELWIIAGAFGTYLDLNSALRVGMFPPAPVDRFRQVGNAAGVGAKEMLLSLQRRDEASQIIRGVKYIELTTHPHFTARFLEAMYFPTAFGSRMD